ncbi:MAG: hypothetical protein ACREQN_15610 [Candidatus Binataceae bacterium]
MKIPIFRLALGAVFAVAFATTAAFAQDASSTTLAPNQTMGFGNGKLLTFTYEQNYDCVDQPTNDLDFNQEMAESDPAEFQTPICQVGVQPTIDPTGRKFSKHTAILYVLVPMFSVDNDQNPNDAIACPAGVRSSTLCGSALGSTLIQLFGAVPEAFKTTPLVATQCPDPGSPPGTCTMHSSTVDLGTALVALGKLPPPATNIFVPTPNHSHVIDNSLVNTKKPIWWEVKPVLVTNQADWPTADGGSGITSAKEMDAAEKAGDAIEVPSNFYLFFSSKGMKHMTM